MTPAGRRRGLPSGRALAAVVPAAFLLLFFAYPVTALISAAIRTSGPAGSADVGRLTSVIAFTIFEALLSTALTLAVALPGALVLGRYRFRGRSLVEALAVVAFVMPTVVVAAAIAAVLADDGPLSPLLPDGSDRGLGAILAAHVYFNIAVVLRMVGGYLAQLDVTVDQAAAVLGASPTRLLIHVTLPRLRPAILAAGAIVFLFTFTSYGIVLLLGSPGQSSIEVEIARQALSLFQPRIAAVLSLVQIVMVLAILAVQRGLSRRLRPGGGGAVRLRHPVGVRQKLQVASLIGGCALILGGPVLMVVARSLRMRDGWGLDHYTGLFSEQPTSVLPVAPIVAVGNSLRAAFAATVIALVVGGLMSVAVAHRRAGFWEGIWLLPMGVSAVTLGLGILLAFGSAPLAWRGSWWMVPVAQSLVAIPFVVRAVVPALRAIDPRVRESAALLAASPWRVFRWVDLPLVARALAVAVGFSLAISLGEFGATGLVARGDSPTVPVAMYRLLGTPGAANQGQAMALAVVLIVLAATAVLAVQHWRLPGERDV